MPASSTTRRSLGASIVALVALVVTVAAPGAPAAIAQSDTEVEFVMLINHERAAVGLPPLAVAGDLTTAARQHSAVMSAGGTLHHNPRLGESVSGWHTVGENVGVGGRVEAIHDAFMASAGHRRNILDPDLTELGIGVVVDGSERIWVTEVFRTPSSVPAAASSASR